MVRTIITGADGRMGMRLVALTQETDGLSLTGAIEMKDHPALGKDAGEIAQFEKTGILLTENLHTCLAQSDVVIDFTAAEASLRHIDVVAGMGKTIVVESLEAVEKAMNSALEELASATETTEPLPRALRAEQSAYQALLRLEEQRKERIRVEVNAMIERGDIILPSPENLRARG